MPQVDWIGRAAVVFTFAALDAYFQPFSLGIGSERHILRGNRSDNSDLGHYYIGWSG
jgi:hypothetical protein